MASAAENLAANMSLANFAKATDLKKRLWFTLGALIVFRFLSFVPLPGIDPRALSALFDTTRGGVLDFFNMFSGGSLERMSLIALGVMPYITASIVMQLATTMSPTLNALKKEGESGRKKINQYTRYGTVFLCSIQGYFMAVALEGWGATTGQSAVIDPGMMFRITVVISLVGGSMFLMWLGEQITSRGIGNGISLIIMAGIVAQLPTALAQLFEGGRTGSMDPFVIFVIVVLALGLVVFICFMERAQRRVLIQYPKRQSARGQIQQERSHLPLKVNTAGVIPPIFASSLLLMPLTIAQFSGQGQTGDTWWSEFVITITTALQHGAPPMAGQPVLPSLWSPTHQGVLPSATIFFVATAWPLTITSTGTVRVSPMRARSMCQYGLASNRRLRIASVASVGSGCSRAATSAKALSWRESSR